MSIEKSCNNCMHKENFCKIEKSKYCINLSSHEFPCSYCKWKFNSDNIKFCRMDDGDDGMSCCGDKFELDEKYK